MIESRLKIFFLEAKTHISKIKRAKEILKEVMPIKNFDLDEIKSDKLDILAFRFAKLQDLMGEKIFRLILEYSGISTEGKRFVEILSELEKEGLIDIDKWIELRRYRNSLAHEYPYEENIRIEAINFIYKNIDYLISLLENLEEYYNEIKRNRDKKN